MKHTVIPAVHLFLIKENKILLARRFNTWFHDGDWSVTAGHVESGESPIEAMIREAQEEAGIQVDTKNLICSHVMSRIWRDERVDFFFTCKNWTGEPEIMEPHKCDAMQWFEIEKIPDNIYPLYPPSSG
jgi:ADP-ribose pyrophosphatase YjhB (NUDIX family)